MNRKRISKSICILKGDCPAYWQRLATVNKAIIVPKTLENTGVDESSRAKPTATEVYSGNVTAGDTNVHDLHSVGWDTTRKRSCGSLIYDNIWSRTFVPPNSVWFQYCSCSFCTKKQIRQPLHKNGMVSDRLLVALVFTGPGPGPGPGISFFLYTWSA